MFARLHLRKSAIIALLVALAMIATMSTAFAAKGGNGKGKGGGSGGGRPTTEVSNNLSVPAVFIGNTGSFVLQNTDGTLLMPQGDPSTGYELPGYYYVQGQNLWQAGYVVQGSDTVTAKWGDNLTGTAMKRVGHQIRVEMGLTSDTHATDMQGFSVVKLNTSQADNVSPWGTLATANGDGTYSASAATMQARVWVAGAEVQITDPLGTVTTFAMPGEINASGAVTFGYNWKPTEAGKYTLKFLVPTDSGVTFSNPAATSLEVTITAGGSGGGGGRP